MFKNIKAILLLLFFAIIFLAKSGITVQTVAGDHVVVACNTQNKEYYAPPYVTKEEYETQRFVFMRLGDAEKLGYEMNREHQEEGCFTGPDTSLLFSFILGVKEPKWGKDGNWGVPAWKNLQ